MAMIPSVFHCSHDRILFSAVSPKKLPETLRGDPQEMSHAQGFRIPSLLYADSDESDNAGVLLAAADRANDGSDWGSIGVAMRQSTDGGIRWSTPLTDILRPPVHHKLKTADEWSSAFYIDPVLLQNRAKQIVLAIDFFPESRGFHTREYLEPGTGMTSDGRLLLTDAAAPAEGGTFCNPFSVGKDGWIYDPQNRKTSYYFPQKHNPDFAYETIGDLYYAVGEPDYLTVPPPRIPQKPAVGADIYVGNVFLNIKKPAYSADHPIFVQKRLAEAQDAFDEEILETDPAPLRAAVSCHIVILKSSDGGKNWSSPVFITHKVKPADALFFGTGPGVGLTLKQQKDSANGRLLLPVYEPGRAYVLLSDDGGESWRRAAQDAHIPDEMQAVELSDGTVLAFGRPEVPGCSPCSLSRDGGEHWERLPDTALRSTKCQKSVIACRFSALPAKVRELFSEISAMQDAEDILFCSHPCEERRGSGLLSVGIPHKDGSVQWITEVPLCEPELYRDAETPDFFAYSCLSMLPDGNIGLLYEPQPRNCIAFKRISFCNAECANQN